MKFLSSEYEPVRRYLYGVFGSLLAVAAVYGLFTAEQALVVGSVVASVFLIPAVEAARARVRPSGAPEHRAEG